MNSMMLRSERFKDDWFSIPEEAEWLRLHCSEVYNAWKDGCFDNYTSDKFKDAKKHRRDLDWFITILSSSYPFILYYTTERTRIMTKYPDFKDVIANIYDYNLNQIMLDCRQYLSALHMVIQTLQLYQDFVNRTFYDTIFSKELIKIPIYPGLDSDDMEICMSAVTIRLDLLQRSTTCVILSNIITPV